MHNMSVQKGLGFLLYYKRLKYNIHRATPETSQKKVKNWKKDERRVNTRIPSNFKSQKQKALVKVDFRTSRECLLHITL